MPKKNDDLVPITEFITASQNNLEIAAAVFDHYPAARDETLTSFFHNLGERLVGSQTGWWFDYSPKFFTERYGAFKIAKEGWQGKYEIRIEAHNWGEKIIGGVWRHHGILRHTNYIPGLQEAFAGASLHPKRWMWYEAQFDLQSPSSDWREPGTLWRIQTDPRFLDEVEALFRSWMEIAVPHLDQAIETQL